MFNTFKKHTIKYTEKEILCDLIEKYIEIANKNDTTIDDCMSIIALIKMLQIEYKEYAKDFQRYLDLFRNNGLLDEYQTYFKSVPKQIFTDNHFRKNPNLARDMLYGFFNGCTSRFMNYLILFGLCGKPITTKQKYIMATIFEGNSASFSKQRIYYTNLYLKGKLYVDGIWYSWKDKYNYIICQYYSKYKNLALAYRNEEDIENFEKYMLKASKYNVCANEELAKYYIDVKNFEKARICIKKLDKNAKKFAKEENISYQKRYDYKIKPLVDYYKFKLTYPYIRKDLLEMFDLDIKTFNNITEDIKDNIDYKLNRGYSERTIEYLKEKLKD